MDAILKKRAEKAYLILAAIFLSALVASNLIFQKFFQWAPFGIYTFELSVGILPYPVTFIVTDLVSEVYGKKRANQMVFGRFCGIFIYTFNSCSCRLGTATPWSPISDQTFSKVFGFTFVAVGASMTAYLIAQLVDVQLFHFWKKLTKGKHLWLRNNASTFTSQLVDTLVVLFILCSLDVIPLE
jgi:uncharacterized integral membrane protein (TIGR00697 family)